MLSSVPAELHSIHVSVHGCVTVTIAASITTAVAILLLHPYSCISCRYYYYGKSLSNRQLLLWLLPSRFLPAYCYYTITIININIPSAAMHSTKHLQRLQALPHVWQLDGNQVVEHVGVGVDADERWVVEPREHILDNGGEQPEGVFFRHDQQEDGYHKIHPLVRGREMGTHKEQGQCGSFGW